MGILQDKVIVVTGSSRGLGLAVAQAAAAEGATERLVAILHEHRHRALVHEDARRGAAAS